jgi:lipoprotein-anchoring transpeptidase ErfK/SrfK
MRGRGLVALAVLAAGAAGGLGAGLLQPGAGSAGSDRADPLGRAATGLGRGPRPAFVPGRPALLAHGETAYPWAPVVHPATALGAPGSGAPVAALAARTPEDTTNLVLVLGASRRRGRQWVHVRLPVLPNDSTGWVPRSALGGYHFVRTHLVVDQERLRATLYRDGRAIFHAPVGTGQPQSPTPPGEFYIRDKLTDYASPFYGPVAFGTSARSAVLTDWPDGGYVGIHGTDAPGAIPGRVSHGCIRLRDDDILRLARLMPVGTPLTIR